MVSEEEIQSEIDRIDPATAKTPIDEIISQPLRGNNTLRDIKKSYRKLTLRDHLDRAEYNDREPSEA